MSLIVSGIDDVRAFELPGGICSDGSNVAVPRLTLVKWKSVWGDKFYQVYVNGRYAGVTLEQEQRQMVVHLPSSPESAARIEVFAVEAGDAYKDFSSELNEMGCQIGRVMIKMLRDQRLPLGAVVNIYSDNGSGQISYENPVSDEPINVWPSWLDKCGFGMGCFGDGDFGYDSGAAVGFGVGSFGRGQFGLDADEFDWVSEPLMAGTYKFGVKVVDKQGKESSCAETEEITVIPAVQPAESLSIDSFDKQTNQLVLNIS